jgi:hypothetical protein
MGSSPAGGELVVLPPCAWVQGRVLGNADPVFFTLSHPMPEVIR